MAKAVYLCGLVPTSRLRLRTLACPACNRPTVMILGWGSMGFPPEAQCCRCLAEYTAGMTITEAFTPDPDFPDEADWHQRALAERLAAATIGPAPTVHGVPGHEPSFDFCLPTWGDEPARQEAPNV